MASRWALTDIVDYVRVNAGITDSDSVFTYERIQMMLDQYRLRVRGVELVRDTTTEYYGPTFLEREEGTLVDGELALVTPASSDDMTGYYLLEDPVDKLIVTSAWEHDPANVIADIIEYRITMSAAMPTKVNTGKHSIDRSKQLGVMMTSVDLWRGQAKRPRVNAKRGGIRVVSSMPRGFKP